MIRYWAGAIFFAVTPSDQPPERNPRNRADMAWCWHSSVSLVAEISRIRGDFGLVCGEF